MDIGDRVKIFRKERKWTQEDLAKASGLSKNSIYNYENGKRNMDIETLERIANALNIPFLDLLIPSNDNEIRETIKRHKRQNKIKNKIDSEIKHKSYYVLKKIFEEYGYRLSYSVESEAHKCNTDIFIYKDESIVAIIDKYDLEKVAFSFYSTNLGLIKNVIDNYKNFANECKSLDDIF